MTKTIKSVSLAVALLLSPVAVSAQTETTANDSVSPVQANVAIAANHILFGYLSYGEALKQMPLYADAQKSLEQLKTTYKQELDRSEQEFSKLFEEYVDGQKSFPENILLKRQKELQQLLEQTLAFKDETQRLLTNAEAELMLPVNKQQATEDNAATEAVVELKEVTTPAEAIERLKEGNARYSSDQAVNPHDNSQRLNETAPHQAPFCAVVACSDSRVPVEHIFDQGIGDIFVIRTAGNSVNGDLVMGSVDYAIEHLKVKSVIVMGHESCGGVTGAITEPEEEVENSKIDELLATIREDVRDFYGQEDKLDDAIRMNASKQVERILANPEVKEKVEKGELSVVGAYYNVHTGKVDFVE